MGKPYTDATIDLLPYCQLDVSPSNLTGILASVNLQRNEAVSILAVYEVGALNTIDPRLQPITHRFDS